MKTLKCDKCHKNEATSFYYKTPAGYVPNFDEPCEPYKQLCESCKKALHIFCKRCGCYLPYEGLAI